MLTEPINNALHTARQELIKMAGSARIVYDVHPIIELTKQITELVNDFGIKGVSVPEVKPTDISRSEYMNRLSYDLYRTFLSISRMSDELLEKVNSILERYTDNINSIDPLLVDLRTRLADIEAQTLEKVTNTSIRPNEIKVVNFSNNVSESTVELINNTMMLPIRSKTKILVNDQAIGVLGPTPAKNLLGRKIDSTINKYDRETIIGTYFGNIIGRLDGGENFVIEGEIDPSLIFDTTIDQAILATYYSNNLNDHLKVSFENIFNEAQTINFIEIEAHGDIEVYNMRGGDKTKLGLRNNVWVQSVESDNMVIELTQRNPEPLVYQAIDVIDKNTSTLVKRHNYFSSLNFIFPDILERLNPEISTSPIDLTLNQTTQLTERTGFYKYATELTYVGFYENQYNSSGMWASELIKTNKPIHSVEIMSEHSVPNDTIEYIQYEISFDNTTWYPIRAINEGITDFNNLKKKRIVLTNDNLNDDYMYIGPQESNRGVYLRIHLNGNASRETPAIYNLELRIKVNEDA